VHQQFVEASCRNQQIEAAGNLLLQHVAGVDRPLHRTLSTSKPSLEVAPINHVSIVTADRLALTYLRFPSVFSVTTSLLVYQLHFRFLISRVHPQRPRVLTYDLDVQTRPRRSSWKLTCHVNTAKVYSVKKLSHEQTNTRRQTGLTTLHGPLKWLVTNTCMTVWFVRVRIGAR